MYALQHIIYSKSVVKMDEHNPPKSLGVLSVIVSHYARYQRMKGRHRVGASAEETESDSLSIVTTGSGLYRKGVDGIGMDFLIKDPICRGYLLAFCHECYNAESMLFLIEVEKFREVLKPDRALWNTNYKEIDSTVRNNPDKEWTWKARVSLESVMTHVDHIYDKFIKDGAENQICLSASVLGRTNQRVKLIAAYGRVVFSEAALDPLRTLEKDILPRFVSSQLYRTLCDKLDALATLPSKESLVVDPPDEQTDLDMGAAYGADREFTLEEILKTKFLYEKFLSHLRAKLSSENVLCKRLILLFYERMEANDRVMGDRIAWDLYQYFVASHSAYEVSLEFSHKSELKFHLAKPCMSMFDALLRSVSRQLNADFLEFKTTATYSSLARNLQIEVEKRVKAKKKVGRGICFGS